MANPNIKDYASIGGKAKKGSKHKFPTALKDKVLFAAAALEAEGKSLTDEAQKDPRWFWENFVKPMLPKDIALDVDGSITVNLRMIADE